MDVNENTLTYTVIENSEQGIDLAGPFDNVDDLMRSLDED